MEKSSLMMIVIIFLLVALLGTIVGVTFYAFNMVQNMEAQAAGFGFERQVRVLHPDDISYIMIGEPITTNLAAEGGAIGNHMARVQLAVGYDNTQGRESNEAAQLIQENMTVIRMMAIDALGNRTFQELSTQGSRNELAYELLYSLQNDFRSNMIVSVGFYEWMIN